MTKTTRQVAMALMAAVILAAPRATEGRQASRANAATVPAASHVRSYSTAIEAVIRTFNRQMKPE